MRLKILDKKMESSATCYLCRVDLNTYIESIPDTYKDFDVQRGIVSNRYLDHLAETIHERKHIPPIVLIADRVSETNETLEVNDYRILDGLQRTHRLKIIWEMVGFLVDQRVNDFKFESAGKFMRTHSKEIRALGGDLKLVNNLIEFDCLNIQKRQDFFSKNTLWLEVWTGLDQAAQIDKMLLLNAGHKSVNIKHQLELLFLSTLLKLDDIAPKGVQFIREKDQSSIQYSKNRKLGQYHSSHMISALIAMSAGKIISTNNDLVSDMQFDQSDYVELVEGFNLQMIKKFIQFLYSFDCLLHKIYDDLGVKWLGREVVLIGIFAAIGEYSQEMSQSPIQTLNELDSNLSKLIQALKLKNFEVERNDLELNKINIGKVNKKAVFQAMHDQLRNKKFKGWDVYFGSGA